MSGGARTKREQLQQKMAASRKKAIPQWVKGVLNVTFILPIIMLFMYSTGMWSVKVVDGQAVKDGLDNIIVSFCIFAGTGGLILLNVLLNAYTEEE